MVALLAFSLVGQAWLAGCTTDPGGHVYNALNESGNDVIVELTTSGTESIRLPAHTRGPLSTSWDVPTEAWRISVLTTPDCIEIASFPLKGQPPRLTLHITAAGDMNLGSETAFSFEGKDVRLVAPLPTDACDS